MEESIKIIYYMIILNFFLLIFILIKKKANKKSYKYGHYTLSSKIQKLYYIFSKKRKTENTFRFRVYGRILIELKYYETDKVSIKIKEDIWILNLSRNLENIWIKAEKLI